MEYLKNKNNMEFYWITKKEKALLDKEAHKNLSKKFQMVGSNKNAEYWNYDNGFKEIQVGVPKQKDSNFKSEFKEIII